MIETRILHCTRSDRPCACGELVVYDRSGRIAAPGRGMYCLTNVELYDALIMLAGECRRRLSGLGASNLLLDC
jgi:hypothetical protein